MEEVKYIIFRLGEEKYGMKLENIFGIEQNYQVIPVPNSPKGVKGIVNLRGLVVPVYSLRERFGMESRIENPGKSILVTQSSGTPLAFEVDAVEEIEEVAPEEQNPMPAVVKNDETVFMEKVLHVKDKIVVVINADKVLSEEVRQALNQMVEENK